MKPQAPPVPARSTGRVHIVDDTSKLVSDREA
jgi:hypothetical protein